MSAILCQKIHILHIVKWNDKIFWYYLHIIYLHEKAWFLVSSVVGHAAAAVGGVAEGVEEAAPRDASLQVAAHRAPRQQRGRARRAPRAAAVLLLDNIILWTWIISTVTLMTLVW